MRKVLNVITLIVMLGVNIMNPFTYAISSGDDFEEIQNVDEAMQEDGDFSDEEKIESEEENDEILDEDQDNEKDTDIDEEDENTDEIEEISENTDEEAENNETSDIEQENEVDEDDNQDEETDENNHSGEEIEDEDDENNTPIEVVDEIVENEIEELSGDIAELTGEVVELTGEVVELTGNALELSIARQTLNEILIQKSEYYNGVTVNVEAQPGTFPQGTELRIKPITLKKELNEIKEQIIDSQENVSEESELVAFDISFIYTLSGGNEVEVQPKNGEGVKVTFDYTDNKTLSEADNNDEQEVKVFHIDDKDENGEKVEKGEEVVKDVTNEEESEEVGITVANAESFSVYAVVATSGNGLRVTYDLNGGYWVEDHDTNPRTVIYTGTKTTMLYRTPSKTGYTFMGWYDETLTNRRKDGVVTDGMTVYAKWQEFGDLNVYVLKSDNNNEKYQYALMERNLGATSVYDKGTTPNPESQGYYYQWGNNYGFDSYLENNSNIVYYGTDQERVDASAFSWESPYYSSKFIKGTHWMTSRNRELWGDGEIKTNESKQGPCPEGYHIPSKDDWQSLLLAWGAVNKRSPKDFYSDFLIPSAGYRARGDSKVTDIGKYRYYTSSWVGANFGKKDIYALASNDINTVPVISTSADKDPSHERSSNGLLVRCFKNVTGSLLNVSNIDLNGGQNAIISVASGVVVSLQEPTKGDLLFGGFYTNEDYIGEKFKEVGDVIPEGTTHLYAKWNCPAGQVEDQGTCVPGFEISFNATKNGGTTTAEDIVVTGGVVSRTINLADYTAEKEGYYFVGWNTDSGAGIGLQGQQTFTQNTVLYAIFLKLYTYTFLDEEEEILGTGYYESGVVSDMDRLIPLEYYTGGKESDTSLYPALLTLGLDDPSKGWKWTPSLPEDGIATGDLILHGEKLNKYTVTFKNNDSTDFLSYDVVDGTIIKEPATHPEILGYTFLGWYEDEELTAKFNFPSKVITQNTIIYPAFKEILCTFVTGTVGTGISINGFSGTQTNDCLTHFVIPSEIDGKKVLKIGDNAFNGDKTNAQIISGEIILPDTLTSIGSSSFYNNNISGTLRIPGGVTTVNNAFKCNPLEEVIFGEGITTINPDSFRVDAYNCSNDPAKKTIKGIVLPSTLTTIGGASFLGQIIEGELELPESLTSIGDYAFYYNNISGTLKIPGGITTVYGNAFKCNPLEEVIFGEGITTINNSSFRVDTYNCSNDPARKTIKRISLPNTLITIGDNAFDGQIIEGELIIPDSVQTIGNYAFNNNKLTGELIIPNSVISIGNYAFDGNNGGNKIGGELIIPDSVQTIGNYAFRKNQITGLILGNSVQTIGNNAFESNQITGELIIPNSVISIGNNAFESNQITGLILGSSLQTIGNNAFNRNQLTGELIIPNSVQTIGNYAFDGYNGNNRIGGQLVIPDSVISIGEYAFRKNQISGLTLGSSVQTIGKSVFEGNKIEGELELPESLTNIGDYAFYNNNISGILRIPGNMNNGVVNSAFRCNLIEEVIFGEGITTINIEAFRPNNCSTKKTLKKVGFPTTLTTIGTGVFQEQIIEGELELPGSLTSIGDYAFYKNNISGTLIIPGGITTINGYAFRCNPVEEVIFGEGITTINKNAFNTSDCNNKKTIKKVTFPSTLESIGDSAFYNQIIEGEFIFPESLTTLGTAVFRGNYISGTLVVPGRLNGGRLNGSFRCNLIENVIIEEGISVIGEGAFYDQNKDGECPKSKHTIKSVQFPSSLTGIESNAFWNNQLTGVIIGENIETIGGHAFDNQYNESGYTLKSVILNDKLQNIGYRTFATNDIKSVYIPDSVETLDSQTFDQGSDKLGHKYITGYVTTKKSTLDYTGAYIKPLYQLYSYTFVNESGDILGTGYYPEILTSNTTKLIPLDYYNGVGNINDFTGVDSLITPSPGYEVEWSIPLSENSVVTESLIVTGTIVESIRHTVIFKNPFTGDIEKYVLDNHFIDEPEIDEKEGYTFLGWYWTGLEIPFDFTGTAITGDITIYAKWSINNYTVTFNKNSEYGTVSTGGFEVEYGTAVSTSGDELIIGGETVRATPNQSDAKYEYYFNGWGSTCGSGVNPTKYGEIIYKHDGAYKFDGTNYIKTETSLFSEDNYKRDFELSFDIEDFDYSTEEQGSFVNAMQEAENNGYSYPGFVFRRVSTKNNSSNGNIYEIDANIFDNHKNMTTLISNTNVVKITRRNQKLYVSYNGNQETEVINFINFNQFFDVPVTIGASLTGDGTPFRYIKGTLSGIELKYINTGVINGELITGDCTITANFSRVKKSYPVIFKNEDGTVLDEKTVEYGITPEYTGAIPTKPSDTQYDYIFAGWSPELGAVEGNQVYVAEYNETIREYTVGTGSNDGTQGSVTVDEGPYTYGKRIVFRSNVYDSSLYKFVKWELNGHFVTTGENNEFWTGDLVIENLTGDVVVTGYFAAYSGCSWNGGMINHGESVTGYQKSEVPYGQTCEYEIRTCNDGELSGSYQYASCIPESASSCELPWGGTTGHGAVVTGYKTESETCPNSCKSQQATCNNGSWDVEGFTGTYTKSSCITQPVVIPEDYILDVCPAHGNCSSITGYTVNEYACVKGEEKYRLDSCEVHYHTGSDNKSCEIDRFDIVWKYRDEKGERTGNTINVEYGKNPTQPSYPTIIQTAQTGYTFSGWTPEVSSPVTTGAEYTAQYNETTREYLITFLDGDGEIIQTGMVAYGATPAYTGEIPTKTATAQYSYSFNNTWEPEIVPVTTGAEYTAQFDSILNKYTVTINVNTNSGSVSTGSVTENWGSLITENGNELTIGDTTVIATAKTGDAQYIHEFSRWNNTCGDKVETGCSIEAEFTSTIREYTITFHSNEGSVVTGQTKQYGSHVDEPADPTRQGYGFSGWYSNISLTQKYNFTETVTGDLDLYAKWTPITYTIGYELNGGILPAGQENPTTYTIESNDITLKNPTRIGYIFTGWTGTDLSTESTEVTIASGSMGDRVYYANWQPDNVNVTVYYFTQKLNSSTNELIDEFDTHDIRIVQMQSDLEFNIYNEFYEPIEGFEYVRATVTEQDTSEHTETTTTVLPNGNRVINLYYTRGQYNFAIIPVDNVTTQGSSENSGYYYGATITLSGSSSNDCFMWSGWTNLPEGTINNSQTSFTMPANAISLSGVVTEKTYNISFNGNGADEGEMETLNGISCTQSIYLPINKFKKVGHTFTGWTTTIDGSKEYNDGARIQALTTGNNTTVNLIAVWDINKYDIVWKNYNGETLDSQILEYGVIPEYGGEYPLRDSDIQFSYSFSGWTPEIQRVEGPQVYTAVYSTTLNEYTITWDVDGTITTETYEYGAIPYFSGSKGKVPDKQYIYTFSGWTPQISPVSGNITYTATYTATLRKYTVTWINSNGDVLEIDENVPYGTTPTYDGPTPTKEGDTEHHYTFTGWAPAVGPISGDTTYEAIFDSTKKEYTIIWQNENGGILETDEDVPYGTMPSYDGPTPTKESDAHYSYEFAGWTPETGAVVGHQTYTATYTAIPRKYTVTWKNSNGSVIRTDTGVEYGTTLEYQGPTPTSGGNAQYSYEFTGWNPAIGEIHGDTTYTAVYTHKTNKYTITWKNRDGTVIKTVTGVEYGATPIYGDVSPTKTGDAQYSYEFIGWDPGISTVTGDTSYTAKFKENLNRYKVIFINDDSGILKEATEYDYGTSRDDIEKPADPTKASDVQYSYEFAGWDPSISVLTGDITFKATYTFTVNKYTVTWKNRNGSIIKTNTGVEYGTEPEYDGPTPTKESTSEYSYRFTGWEPAIGEIHGDTTYTAQFEPILESYTITWKDRDGKVLKVDENVPYGVTPVYSGANPSRSGNIQYDYIFDGWTPSLVPVHGDATYTAKYRSELKKYKVIWKNWDDEVLETDENVLYGSTPKYDGEEPTKPGSPQYSYVFDRWTPNIHAVDGDVVYKAVFEELINKYTVTWENWDESVIKTDTGVEYGTVLEYDGPTPTKEGDAQYSYEFSGWDNEIKAIHEDTTYRATYIQLVNEYLITFLDGDGKTIQTGMVAYGDTPSYTGSTPTKAKTQEYTYTFNNTWSPEIHSVGGEETYTAQFNSTKNKYTITINANTNSGSINTGLITAEYGTPITESGNELKIGDTTVIATAKPSDAQYTHEFSGWNNTCGLTLNDGCTIEAEFRSIVNKYLITFLDGDGKTIQTGMVAYGATPNYTGSTPTKAKTQEYTYTFNGNWSPAIHSVTTGETYTAQFNSTKNKYTITINANTNSGSINTGLITAEYGTSITESGNELKIGDTTVIATAKPSDAQYTHEFSGRNNTCGLTLNDGCIIEAEFRSIIHKYTVIWNNEDGMQLEKDENVPYGTMPQYNGTTPVKPGDGSGAYVFDGWNPNPTIVVGNVEYTAKYKEKTSPQDDNTGNRRSGGGRKHTTSQEIDQHGSAEDIDNPSNPEKEVFDAYKRAYKYGITTIDNEQKADPNGYVTRGHLAKMVVNFTVNVLGRDMPVDTPTKCKRNDDDSEWKSSEIKFYAEKSCALGVMGLYTKKFMPNKIVDRAEFGTVVSRILWGDKYNELDTRHHLYFTKHLKALHENGFMKDIDNPLGRKEFRKRVWLVLKRIELEKNMK